MQLQRLKPVPQTIAREQALPAIARFLAGRRDVELVWLADGTDLGGGDKFVRGLARTLGSRTITIVSGGVPGARALAAADNAAGGLSVTVLRVDAGGAESGSVRALDLKGLSLGEAHFAFKPGERATPGALRSAGRNP